MHSFVAILDSRPSGSRFGVKRTCALCQRKHLIWVCFREVVVQPVPGKEGMVRYAPTGKVVVTGTECAKKVQIPIWEEPRVIWALEDPQKVIRPGHDRYATLFQEFR